ncbi:hypothetical protein J4402_03245 [Candidatus Pacearchaeota archaeon]|nr:hypothetical protein [Candidatus Pacearchaeota archaeon]
MDKIVKGNVEEQDFGGKKGWFIGHMACPDSVFNNQNFEVKWAVQSKGWKEKGFGVCEKSKTMCVLIEGKFLFDFPGSEEKVILSKRGDFVFWREGEIYSSETLEDSVLLVIRWPSIGDKKYISE